MQSELDDGTESTLSKPADDAKFGGVIYIPDGHTVIQVHLSGLDKWAERFLNEDKYNGPCTWEERELGSQLPREASLQKRTTEWYKSATRQNTFTKKQYAGLLKNIDRTSREVTMLSDV